MREHLRGPNLVTSANLVLGLGALLLVPRHLGAALALVVLAAVLDVVDGALARRAGGGTAFGAQLDSLADLVCFCVVPALALARAADGAGAATQVPAVAVAGAFLLGGAWRLARFPLVQQQGAFVGLPTPAAGALLLLLLVLAPVPVAAAGGAALSALMVSTVRFPSVFAAAATVRHPGLRERRPFRQVRRLRVPRPHVHRPQLRRPHLPRPHLPRPRLHRPRLHRPRLHRPRLRLPRRGGSRPRAGS
ncbi:CDP-alcohol phosphatidyltransferase family protein [Vallicoccus soli]|uniref:CDP-diacylglycerol--serine O-phosphatidyltransferase n=1 Tax=Vallicoccus soli TaxID=2339232 RepID=A0A3A3YX58_9ACTN|nr:CDP-alcohol phosphatidyltransferase family protein [Vallicoccus soli]RJK95303.1 hypothetical protein D5H78_11580 [Vallicoccus soli]